MDLILWLVDPKYQFGFLLVSILVLVDLILWHTPEKTKNYETLGFNPCFGGSYIVTAWIKAIGKKHVLFQSLFWWILYCDVNGSRLLRNANVVSILVLVDLILWPWSLYWERQWRPVSILVLVDLILWRIFWIISISSFHSFNPCFGGSYIVTERAHWVMAMEECFNPCFGGSYIVTGRCRD